LHFREDALRARDGGQAWALRLEGKTDQEKFKELGWGLRTWPALALHAQINLLSLYSRSGPGDQWNFNECLPREIFTPLNHSVFSV